MALLTCPARPTSLEKTMKSSRHTFFGRLLRGAAIVLALSGALSAQDWWARFGVQGSYTRMIDYCNVPDGPVNEKISEADGAGPGLGIFWEVPFTDNLYHVVGLQFNFASDVTTFGVNYDLHYYLAGDWQIGPYGLAGLGYLHCSREGHYYNDVWPYWHDYENSVNTVGLNLGVGHYFTRHLGAEAKLVLAANSWTHVQFSAKLRF